MLGFLNDITGRIAIGVGLALLTLVAFLSFQLDRTQAKLDDEREAKNVALAANAANAETIQALEDRISRDSELLRELRGLRTEIAAASDQRRADLDAIAESDDEARDFLSMPVPDSLREPQGGNADADSNPAG